jgi:hypothetical protein
MLSKAVEIFLSLYSKYLLYASSCCDKCSSRAPRSSGDIPLASTTEEGSGRKFRILLAPLYTGKVPDMRLSNTYIDQAKEGKGRERKGSMSSV